MLTTIAVLLILVWAIAVESAYMMGGFVHVLVAAAVVMLIVPSITKKARGPWAG